MGIPVVESFNTQTGLATNSITLTKPSGVVNGDLLLIILGNDDIGSVAQWTASTKPTGFTFVQESGSALSDSHIAYFWRIADGTEGATIVCPADFTNDYFGWYLRITGAHNSAPIDITGPTDVEGPGATHVADGIVTTVDDCLAFYILAFDGGDGPVFAVSGAGWSRSSELQAGTGAENASGTWGTKEQAIAGATGDATITPNISDGATMWQFAIAPAGGGGGVQNLGMSGGLLNLEGGMQG